MAFVTGVRDGQSGGFDQTWPSQVSPVQLILQNPLFLHLGLRVFLRSSHTYLTQLTGWVFYEQNVISSVVGKEDVHSVCGPSIGSVQIGTQTHSSDSAFVQFLL